MRASLIVGGVWMLERVSLWYTWRALCLRRPGFGEIALRGIGCCQ